MLCSSVDRVVAAFFASVVLNPHLSPSLSLREFPGAALSLAVVIVDVVANDDEEVDDGGGGGA